MTWSSAKLAPWLLPVCALLLIACSSEKSDSARVSSTVGPPTAAVENPVFPGTDWDVSSPEAEGMTTVALSSWCGTER